MLHQYQLYEIRYLIYFFSFFAQFSFIIIYFFTLIINKKPMEAFQWEERDQSTPYWIHMIAGSIAGITQHLSMLPLDNIKTHCQAGSRFKMTQIIKNIYQTGGISNFYSGSSILAMGCIPAHAIYFSIYEKTKEYLNCDQQHHSYKFAIVGALSSLFHDLIMTPTEVIKQRLQLIRTQSQWITTRQLVKNMYKNEGFVSFYRSFGVNYFMNIPFSSMIIMMNQKLKIMFGVKQGDNHLNYYFCGGLAGALASIPTTPFDVIKTKLNTQTCLNDKCEKKQTVCEKLKNRQLRTKAKLSPPQSQAGNVNPSMLSQSMQSITTLKPVYIKYHNVLDTTATIFKQDGLAGFFSGLKMRMAIQSVSSAIAWGTYQMIKTTLIGSGKGAQ